MCSKAALDDCSGDDFIGGSSEVFGYSGCSEIFEPGRRRDTRVGGLGDPTGGFFAFGGERTRNGRGKSDAILRLVRFPYREIE